MNNPLVSVLMTAYNREKYIEEAIESVLRSTYTNFELIVVDDCSKDKTVEIVKKISLKDNRVKVFTNEQNLGDYPNRNKAASYASGKYIKYLDSDDLIYPHCLEVMVLAMESFPKAGYGLSSIPDPYTPFPSCISPKNAYLEHFYGYGHFDRSPASAIIRTDTFYKVGGFSGKRMIGDNEMWFKLSQEYDLVKFPRDLMWYRKHGDQESYSEYSKQYEKMRNEVVNNALSSKKCPLNIEERSAIRRVLKRKNFKSTLLKLIKFKM
jgi:glycosyltransferase involved in cell wall biosynthesis